jgi:LmbE family N-acetylglucosaminyl deacetylase
MLSEKIPHLLNACIVAAHPDDEVLWFSSVVTRVEKVFICFMGNPNRPGLGRGRRAALEQPPLDDFVHLGLDEADVYDLARWPDPDITPTGVELDKARDDATKRRYRENFVRLTEELARRLSGYDTVFTHNPWGEYGHEEHVQVYRAVRHVQNQLGFQLWCSSYTGSRSSGLMARCLSGAQVEAITLETEADFARSVAARYKEQSVWTWPDGYIWPRQESFLRFMPPGGERRGNQSVPLNYLEMGQPRVSLPDHSLRSLARKLRRRLPLAAPDDTPLV